jgi:two-component system copper resistance phosphate regulon response regulator CusR/two-component system response regulator MprA
LVRILIIEDEARMRDLLRDGLREHDHSVVTAADGIDGLAMARDYRFDLILLDLMLPGIDGWQVMRDLRESGNSASVLMLTACDAEPQVIAGLDAGADDYLTKPFAFRELLARIASLGRARQSCPRSILAIDTLLLDHIRHAAYRGEINLGLTRTEFAILSCLVKSAGQPVTRAALLESVWGHELAMSRSNLDSFISLLRKKIDPPSEKRLVHTVKGVGYMVHVETDHLPTMHNEPVP